MFIFKLNFYNALPFAVISAATSNYLINNVLTFRNNRLKKKALIIGLIKFLFVSTLPIIANVGLATSIGDPIYQQVDQTKLIPVLTAALKEAIAKDIFPIITKASADLGVKSYVIGGFVRDTLLNRGEIKDIDILTIGSGIELAEQVANRLPEEPKVQIFKTFGTAMLRYNDVELEFVGARKESYTEDSRNPSVEPGSLQDDQNRRDFTINAMAISLNEVDYGTLLDPFDGLSDLQKKIIRIFKKFVINLALLNLSKFRGTITFLNSFYAKANLNIKL